MSRVLNLDFNVTTGLLNEAHDVSLVKIMVKNYVSITIRSDDFILFFV